MIWGPNRGATILDRLRRVTRDGQWIPEIDGLRFIAIMAVLVFHLGMTLIIRPEYRLPVEPQYWWFERLVSQGNRGVPLFFVISGWILAMPFARQLLSSGRPVSLRKYYLRRVTRLEPPYIASLLLISGGSYAYLRALQPQFVEHLLASIFYVHGLIYGRESTVNLVAWSLEIEIQFYILAPLAVQVYRIRSARFRRALMLLVLIGISLAQIPFHKMPRFELSILDYLQYFGTGILLADLFVLRNEATNRSWAWDALGFSAIGCIFWPSDAFVPTHALIWMPIGVLCLAAMRSRVLHACLANRWVAVVGGMCYSIYLLHFFVLAAVLKVTRRAWLSGVVFPMNMGIQCVLAGVPTLLVCALFYLCVERPCMDPNWPSHLMKKLSRGRIEDIEALDTARRVE